MQKTKIEWADYSWNPVKGLCPTGCWYCYARAIYKRFKWNPKVRLDDIEVCAPHPGERWNSYDQWPNTKPQRVFVGSTIDLFYPNIPSSWIQEILSEIRGRLEIPWTIHHTYIFLTKFPARYAEFDFPKNCWLGTTITSREDQLRISELPWRKKLNCFFVSIEPMLGQIDVGILHSLNWIIVGALTGPQKNQHPANLRNLREIVDWAKTHNVPVFLKNNLRNTWPDNLIQEWPEERV